MFEFVVVYSSVVITLCFGDTDFTHKPHGHVRAFNTANQSLFRRKRRDPTYLMQKLNVDYTEDKDEFIENKIPKFVFQMLLLRDP